MTEKSKGRSFAGILAALLPIFLAILFTGQDLFETWLDLDRAQSIALAILIITATLWITEFIPLFATSFVVVLLQVCWLLPAINAGAGKDEQVKEAVFLAPFSSNIILLFLGGFVLSAVLHKYGLDQRMARRILKRTGKKPSRILIGIIAVSALLSMWMSNTATAAMMLAIVLPIIARIPHANPFSKALALAIPFACNLGGLGTPIGTPPNAIAMRYLAEEGIHVTFLEWMGCTWPFLILFLVILWFLLLKLYPPGDLVIEMELEETESLGWKHYFLIGVFGVTCLGWLTSGLHGLSTGMVSLIPIIICFGGRFLDTRDFRNLSWDILFMLGGGLSLGVGLITSGLSDAIVARIPTDVGTAFVLFVVLATIMTTFMSNTATANLLIPIAVSLQGEVSMLVITIAAMCSTAMALPVSTPPNAIAFGSGILKARDMMLAGLIITVLAITSVLLLSPLYWNLFGLST
ncbi:MAG: SLC13 family permease [Planctomycetota bacterium]